MSKILIIEDDTAFCQMLQKFLIRHGFDTYISFAAHEAEKLFTDSFFDIVLTDLKLPDENGISLLSKIKRNSPSTQVIVMTGYAEVKTAISAIKKGALDYISKPFTPEKILEIITKSLTSSPEIEKSVKNKSIVSSLVKVTGISDVSMKLQEHIRLVAPTEMSILIRGESGTGKEVAAKAIHYNSNRRKGNFVAVDCGAVPDSIASSEFFGHVKGSFTGAIENKVGHFEAANGGTLFLDEIGNLSYSNQIQMLRAIQERTIKKIGGTGEIHIDVRIIAATNENLLEAVKKGNFREDLYHRLNEFTLEIPPLRKRHGDLMLFANYFLEMANKELGKNVVGFSKEFSDILKKYQWPGNLRELKNVVKKAVLFCNDDVIHKHVLPMEVFKEQIKDVSTKVSRHDYEKEAILKALKDSNFNKSKACKLLQISRKTLYNKMNKYKIKG